MLYLGYYNEHIGYFSMTRNKRSLWCFFLLEILDQFYLSAVRFIGNVVGLGFWGWEMVAGEEGKGIIYGVATIR